MSRKGGQQRSAAQRAADMEREARLYLEGKSQAYIATKVGLSQQQVGRDLEVLHRLWIERANSDFAQAVAVEIAKLDNLEREAFQAWEDSKLETTKTVQYAEADKPKSGKDGEKDEPPKPRVKRVIQTKEQHLGDPRYLDRVGWCIEQRLRLMGLLGSVKTEGPLNWPWANNKPQQDGRENWNLAALKPEELEAFEGLLDKIIQPSTQAD